MGQSSISPAQDRFSEIQSGHMAKPGAVDTAKRTDHTGPMVTHSHNAGAMVPQVPTTNLGNDHDGDE